MLDSAIDLSFCVHCVKCDFDLTFCQTPKNRFKPSVCEMGIFCWDVCVCTLCSLFSWEGPRGAVGRIGVRIEGRLKIRFFKGPLAATVPISLNLEDGALLEPTISFQLLILYVRVLVQTPYHFAKTHFLNDKNIFVLLL